MISRSDLVILVVASGALAVGIYRWHGNTQDVSAITIPASSRVVVEPISNTPEPTSNNDTTVAAVSTSQPTYIDSNTSSLADNNVEAKTVKVQTLPEPETVTGIVVSSDTTQAGSTNLGSHRVQSGDYLGKIAQQYGTDVQTLRDLNGINGSIIQIGQEILYPL